MLGGAAGGGWRGDRRCRWRDVGGCGVGSDGRVPAAVAGARTATGPAALPAPARPAPACPVRAPAHRSGCRPWPGGLSPYPWQPQTPRRGRGRQPERAAPQRLGELEAPSRVAARAAWPSPCAAHRRATPARPSRDIGGKRVVQHLVPEQIHVDAGLGRVHERRVADQQCPHRRGEAVEVRRTGLRLVQQRLRGGVVRRHHLPGQRAAQLVRRAGDAEVGQRRPEPRAQDVRRLDIAVHDADLVRGVQRLANLDADLEHVLDRQRPVLAEDLRVRAALAVLHDDVRPVILGHAGIDDRDDVRLARQCHGRRQLPLGVDRHRARVDGDHFDRHRSVEPGLDRPEHQRRGAVRDQLRVVVPRQRRQQRSVQSELAAASDGMSPDPLRTGVPADSVVAWRRCIDVFVSLGQWRGWPADGTLRLCMSTRAGAG